MIERFLKYALVTLMLALVLLVALQVFTRYALNNPTSWSEEAACFVQVYMVFWGGCLAMFRKKTLRITVLVDRLPPRMAMGLDLFMKAMILLFLLTMIWYGGVAVYRLHGQVSPGLQWPKSILYATVPLGGILMLIATFRDMADTVRQWRLPGRES